jgi:thiol-disulfide isomerase/thioredoxin
MTAICGPDVTQTRIIGNGGRRKRVGPRVDLAGLGALIGALVVGTVVGMVWRARSGRLRAGSGVRGGWELAGRAPRAEERVLLLQLSSPVCAPCRQTAAVLDELAARTPGVVHAEIDVAERPEVAAALHVMRTPTMVAFDRSGAELLRLSGVPRADELAAALITTLDAPAGRDPGLPSAP